MKKGKLFSKMICSCLIVTMLMGLLAGCNGPAGKETQADTKAETQTGSGETTTEGGEVSTEDTLEITYPIDTDVTLTLALITNSTVTSAYSGFADTPLWKAMQEATGVKIETMELSSDAFSLLLNGGDLPDLIYCTTGNLPNGVDLAIEDGIIVPLNDYIEYAPDLAAYMEDDATRKVMTSLGGDIYGAPSIKDTESACTSGLMIREDWLNELGMEVPQTPDELYDVLVAFRDKKGATVPLSLRGAHLTSYMLDAGMLTGAFGLPRGNMYQVDGVVHYGYAEPEIKEVFAYLHKLYEEGLLDPEYGTIDANVAKANILSGRSGATTGSCGGNMGSWIPTGQEENPDYSLTGVGSLVSKRGEVALMTNAVATVGANWLFMTSECEYPEIAVQFMNYGYTEEGIMLFNFGVEGESYNMIDGYPTYSELITKNPDGLSKAQALAGWTRASTGGWAFVTKPEYYEQYADMPQQQAAIAAWNNSTAYDYLMPTLTLSDDLSSEASMIKSEIQTFVWESIAAYITGEKSLDKMDTEYFAILESLDVDRYIEIYQEALDAYNAR